MNEDEAERLPDTGCRSWASLAVGAVIYGVAAGYAFLLIGGLARLAVALVIGGWKLTGQVFGL